MRCDVSAIWRTVGTACIGRGSVLIYFESTSSVSLTLPPPKKNSRSERVEVVPYLYFSLNVLFVCGTVWFLSSKIVPPLQHRRPPLYDFSKQVGLTLLFSGKAGSSSISDRGFATHRCPPQAYPPKVPWSVATSQRQVGNSVSTKYMTPVAFRLWPWVKYWSLPMAYHIKICFGQKGLAQCSMETKITKSDHLDRVSRECVTERCVLR